MRCSTGGDRFATPLWAKQSNIIFAVLKQRPPKADTGFRDRTCSAARRRFARRARRRRVSPPFADHNFARSGAGVEPMTVQLLELFCEMQTSNCFVISGIMAAPTLAVVLHSRNHLCNMQRGLNPYRSGRRTLKTTNHNLAGQDFLYWYFEVFAFLLLVQDAIERAGQLCYV